MLRILVCIVVLTLPKLTHLWAAESSRIVKVVMKDGSELKGELVSQDSTHLEVLVGKIKMRIDMGDTESVKFEEGKKVKAPDAADPKETQSIEPWESAKLPGGKPPRESEVEEQDAPQQQPDAPPVDEVGENDGAKVLFSLHDGTKIRARMAVKLGEVWKIWGVDGKTLEVSSDSVASKAPIESAKNTASSTGAVLAGFKHRGSDERQALLKTYGGDEGTEGAVNAGLRWLANHQEADGHWDCVKYGGKQADVACTGLALLAFLGAGHTENAGQWEEAVKRAVTWLKSVQHPDGKYFKQGETHGVGYHHAIAGLAMAEAAGMGRVPATIASAQKGVDYSCNIHQCGEATDKLGWRYEPKQEGDLSVTGWFIMQLKSAKVSGLKVDPASFDGAIKFLDKVEAKGGGGDTYGGHRYGYKDPNSVGHRRTAIGCLGRQFLGTPRERLQGGIEWFVQSGGTPKWGGNGGEVDLYYWYYGSLCVFQQGGELWKLWNADLKEALVKNQRKGGNEDGSWDPVGAYAGYWGRIGQTALACLCLEVYYRYGRE